MHIDDNMKRPKNFRAFGISFVSATDTKPDRIRIKDLRFMKSRLISSNHPIHNATIDIALDWLKHQWPNIQFKGQAETPNGYLLFTDNFQDLLTLKRK